MKDIPGYEGLYAITRCGAIWSYPKKVYPPRGGTGYRIGRWLKPVPNRGGRLTVQLGAGNRYLVHRLVGLTYIQKITGKNHINHIDGNKLNNHVSNLEWCTQSENNKHAWKMGLFDVHRKLSIQDKRNIIELHYLGAKMTTIAEIFGVCSGTIFNVVHRRGGNGFELDPTKLSSSDGAASDMDVTRA